MPSPGDEEAGPDVRSPPTDGGIPEDVDVPDADVPEDASNPDDEC
jgi:hypothetical protein